MKKNIAGAVWFLLIVIHSNLQAQTITDASILATAEQMPEYPGGTDSLMRTIMGGVVYPKLCADSNIQGKVYLRFVVNEDGSISNTEAIKSPHKLLSEAAIAAMGKIQKFIPAKQGGKTVKVWYSLPVSFKIKTQPAVTQPSENFVNVRGDSATFKFVEVMPEFPGGDRELIKFLQKNIKYPQVDRDNDIQGKVIVKFVVTEDGSIESIAVAKGVSAGLDREAMRVVGLMPNWKPGFQMGKPVRVQYMFPIVFKLYGPGDTYTSQESIMEYFDGGYNRMETFFFDNMVYPPAAALTKTEAVINVTCKLGNDLKFHPVTIENDLDSLFIVEAFRLINALPAFRDEIRKTASFFEDTYDTEIIFTLDKRHQTGIAANDRYEATRLTIEGADFFKKEKFDKAFEYFNAAIKYYSLHSDAFYNRAVIELKTNKKAEACDDFRRAYLLGDLDAMNGIKQTCK